jgi:hypothetical protein
MEVRRVCASKPCAFDALDAFASCAIGERGMSNTAEQELRDLHSSATIIRQAITHLRRQLGEWEAMLMKTQNEIYEIRQLQRPRLDSEYAKMKDAEK